MDRPIIFSGAMVRALLDGRKTQTRRLATSPLRKCEVGDRLYVRESWRAGYGSDGWRDDLGRSAAPRDFDPETTAVEYLADDTGELNGPTYPSIHMPRWASRLTLVVQSVRFQRLIEITNEDAIAEGIVWDKLGWHVPGINHPLKEFPIFSRPTPREMYAALWDTLHGSGEWLGNPEVVALTFTIIDQNIDRLAA